jgi:hypothetical protein
MIRSSSTQFDQPLGADQAAGTAAYRLDLPEFRRLQSGIGAFRYNGKSWKCLLTV